MKILVANLGSTSFKFRLFDMTDERQLARGGVERVGAAQSDAFVEIGGRRQQFQLAAPDHGAAIEACLTALTDRENGCLADVADVAGVGFKTVHGGRVTGVRRVDDEVLAAMTEMNAICPAHNPPYIAAMRQLRDRLPQLPQVAVFETGFHATIPERHGRYAVPYEWADEFQLRRWGFHGASHQFVAQRMRELTGRGNLRLVSCHLGGSSSLCACRGGRSVATSMGMSPQTGLPQNNRVGDFDAYAVPALAERMGKCVDEVLAEMATRGGLLGISGTSGDVRDLSARAAAGDERAQLALDVYTTAVRHYLGAYLVELGGLDAIAFTAGIGENSPEIRAAVCADLGQLGIVLDEKKNRDAAGEAAIHAAGSRTHIWIVPTNEELVVARSVKQLLESEGVKHMFLAKVTGSLVATQKVENMRGHKLLIVEPFRLDAETGAKLVTTGRSFVAVDALGAGEGEMVLITQGSSARFTPETKELPIDTVIVGIVDRVDAGGKCVFAKNEE